MDSHVVPSFSTTKNYALEPVFDSENVSSCRAPLHARNAPNPWFQGQQSHVQDTTWGS